MRHPFSLILLFLIVALMSCDEEEVIVSPASITISGKDYPTARIGNLTWTASNYAGPGGVSFNDAAKSEYGKYYSRQELDAIDLPEGWRIPTMNDYKALANAYGITIPTNSQGGEPIKKLISTSHWNNVEGNNLSGFNAFPTGYIFGNSGPIDGDIAEFWTVEGYTLSIQEAGADLKSLRIGFYDSSTSPDYRFTVRFVKD